MCGGHGRVARRAGPALLVTLLAGCLGGPHDTEKHPSRVASPSYEQSLSARQCRADLGARQAIFTPLPDQYFGAGCSKLDAVKLTSLRSDDATLTVTNVEAVTCPLAERFAAWARFGIDRAARQILGSPLVRIETMGAYSCRNVAGTDRRSGHATASAIDVSGFVLADGRRITVLGDWRAGSAQAQQFLRVIHASACKRFGTVLGPDYNPAHHNHLHVELSGSSFCR
jgi:hypothetical protein